MTTFCHHHGLINTSRLVVDLDDIAELKEQASRQPNNLEFLCLNEHLRKLEGFYGLCPTAFLAEIEKNNFNDLSHLDFYKQCCRLLITAHTSNFLTVHSWERRIPAKKDKTPGHKLRRTEYKVLLARLLDQGLLLKNEYKKWRFHLPELYTDKERLLTINEPSTLKVPPKSSD